MAHDLLSLAAEMERLTTAIPEAASQTASRVAFTIVADLAYRTPVDTSNAISNWQTTLDAPASIEIPPHYMGSRGSTYSVSAAETVARAKLVLKAKKPQQAIYIANNADYITDLNQGTSKQAPAGFVEISKMIGEKMIGTFKVKTWLK